MLIRRGMPDRAHRTRLCLKLTVVVVFVVVFWIVVSHLTSNETRAVVVGEVGDAVARVEPKLEGEAAVVLHKRVQPPLSIEVYYETLCPDSRSFVVTELKPAVEHFPPDVLNVTLVPYGKATTKRQESSYSFSCQHGPLECEGNKVHSCAIAHNQKDTRALVEYVSCMIRNNVPPFDVGEKCDEECSFGVWDEIKACAIGNEGSILLAKYGDMTNGLNPSVDFIPTVIVDGRRSDMWKALQNLKGLICERYPFIPEQKEKLCS